MVGCLVFLFSFSFTVSVGVLGGTIHRGRTSSFIPRGGHQSHSLQVQVIDDYDDDREH